MSLAFPRLRSGPQITALTSFRNDVVYCLATRIALSLYAIQAAKRFIYRTLGMSASVFRSLHQIRAINPLFSVGVGQGYPEFHLAKFRNIVLYRGCLLGVLCQ